MEPGHVGRVERDLTDDESAQFQPQWSPATWAGWRGDAEAVTVRVKVPQWSPATWAGWRR